MSGTVPRLIDAKVINGGPGIGLIVKGPDDCFWGWPLTVRERETWARYERGELVVCVLCHQEVDVTQDRLPVGCHAVPGCAVAEATRDRMTKKEG